MIQLSVKTFITTCCFFTLLPICWCQEPTPPIKSGFANEIGIDFATLARGKKGTVILYKHAIGTPKSANWEKRTALRGLVGYYRESLLHSSFPRIVGDSLFIETSQGNQEHYFVNLGVERQLSRRKFRLYYGADAGYRYRKYRADTQYEAYVQGAYSSYDQQQGEVRTNRYEASVFGGGNYFIWPQLSIGLELQVAFAIEMSSSDIIRDDQVISSDTNTLSDFSLNMPRLLYLSFHF